jgi:hypothetical protein
MTVIIGNTSFTVEHFKGVSKEDFIKTYAPLGVEVEEAYQIIQEELAKIEKRETFILPKVMEEILKDDVRKPEKKSK